MQFTKTPKRLVSIFKLLDTDLNMVVLMEIWSHSIELVQHLLNDYNFYYVRHLNNIYGGVGIHVSSNTIKMQVLDNIVVEKTCLCPKYEIESLFLKLIDVN